MQKTSRRSVLAGIAGVVGAGFGGLSADESTPNKRQRSTRFAVSTYSFWQFKNKDLRAIETCIDLLLKWNFIAVFPSLATI